MSAMIKLIIILVVLLTRAGCNASEEEEIKILKDIDKSIRMQEDAKNDKALVMMKMKDDVDIKTDLQSMLDLFTSDIKKDTEINNKKLEDSNIKKQVKDEEITKKENEDQLLNEVKDIFKDILKENEKASENESKSTEGTPEEKAQKLLSLYTDDQKDSTTNNVDDELEKINSFFQKRDDTCKDEWTPHTCFLAAFHGKCSQEEVGKNCKRACRFCCGDANIKLCSIVATLKNRQGYCDSQNAHERLTILCPKTCRTCGRAMTDIPCVTSKYGCCWDGTTAKNHVGTPNDGCKRCVDYQSNTICSRFKEDCRQRYSSGKTVRRWCPKTCRLCGPHALCQDHPNMRDTCIAMAYDGMCKTAFHRMKYMCAKTCGICGKTTIDCKDTPFGCCNDGVTIARSPKKEGCPECTNKENNGMQYSCEFLAAHNACDGKFKDTVRKNCGGSCKVCG